MRHRWRHAIALTGVVVVLALLVYAATRERMIDLRVINATGEVASDLVITFARQGDLVWDDLRAADRVIYSKMARRETLGQFGVGENRGFSIPQSAIFHVKVDYKDAEGRARVGLVRFDVRGGGGHFTRAEMFLKPPRADGSQDSAQIYSYEADWTTLLRNRFELFAKSVGLPLP